MKKHVFLLFAVVALSSLWAVSQDDSSVEQASVPTQQPAARHAPPPANQPISTTFFAMDVAGKYCCSTTDPWPWTGASAETGTTFATWRSLGTGVDWSSISPCPPSDTLAQCTTYLGQAPPTWTCNASSRCYNWGNSSLGFDYYVALAQANHQAIMFTAVGTPAWDSNTSNGCTASSGTCPPSDLGTGDLSWKNFITDLIGHEGVGAIKYLEVWNEPNTVAFWMGTVPQLATLVADAHTAAKAADTNIKIISPPVTSNQVSSGCSPINGYLAQLLTAGIAPNVDIIGFHGYVSLNNTTYYALDASCIATVISGVQTDLKNAGVAGGKAIYDTEASWGVPNESKIDPGETNPSNEEYSFTGITYLVQASNTACSTTPCYPLSGFSWYGWEFENSTGVFWDPTGVLQPPLTNAGEAYVNLYKWIPGATPTAPCSRNSTTSIWTCNFTRTTPAGYTAQAVWSDSSSCSSGCTYNSANGFPSYAVFYRDLVHLPPANVDFTISPAGSIKIGYKPLLLENKKLN